MKRVRFRIVKKWDYYSNAYEYIPEISTFYGLLWTRWKSRSLGTDRSFASEEEARFRLDEYMNSVKMQTEIIHIESKQ